MTTQTDSLAQMVLGVLGQIAPEADLAVLDANVAFRDQLDLDSMDYLNFIIGVHQKTGVEIPEADYPKLTCLADFVGYLRDQMAKQRVI